MRGNIFILLILTLTFSTSFGGDFKTIIDNEERVYLKTDKSLYISGEILWYSVRLFNNETGALTDKNTFVYLEILDSLNHSVIRQVAEVKNGGASGSLLIPAEILSGNYFIRAYTSVMKNYGPEVFFHKQLTIINAFKPLYPQKEEVYHVDVKPEGGVIIAGADNKVSVLLTDFYGNIAPFEGYVQNASGDTVNLLKSDASGTGEFLFSAVDDERYNIIINTPSGSSVRSQLSADKGRSIAMATEETGSAFNIAVKKAASAEGKFNLKLLSKGNAVVVKEIASSERSHLITIAKSELPEGILELQILNEQNQVVASRLLYNGGSKKSLVEIKTNKTEFDRRENIEMHLEPASQSDINPSKILVYALKSDVPADLSVKYYRLVSGEVSGIAENILAHAWQNGYINKILLHANKKLTVRKAEMEFPEETNKQTVHTVVKDHSGNVVKGAEVFLSRRSTKVDLYGCISDENGNAIFYIDPDYRNKELIIQTREDYKIDIIQPFSNLFADKKLPAFQLKPEWESYIRNASMNLQVEMSFNASRWNDYGPQETDSSAFYNHPDYSYYLDEYRRFPTLDETITEYIYLGRVRRQDGKRQLMGFNLQTNEFLRAPLLLMDGIPVFDSEKILDYDPYRVKRIDVINSKYFYGPFVFAGIFSFRTFTGKMEDFELPANARRISYEQPENPRLFNNIYYREGLAVETIPDNRTVLLWKDMENYAPNEAIRFSTSDLPGNYTLVAELSYADGSVSTITKEIVVN